MKASEARELAQKRAKELCAEHKAVLDRVVDQIKAALEHQECYSISWYDDLPMPVSLMLEQDGYIVTSNHYRNETIYTISWRKDL